MASVSQTLRLEPAVGSTPAHEGDLQLIQSQFLSLQPSLKGHWGAFRDIKPQVDALLSQEHWSVAVASIAGHMADWLFLKGDIDRCLELLERSHKVLSPEDGAEYVLSCIRRTEVFGEILLTEKAKASLGEASKWIHTLSDEDVALLLRYSRCQVSLASSESENVAHSEGLRRMGELIDHPALQSHEKADGLVRLVYQAISSGQIVQAEALLTTLDEVCNEIDREGGYTFKADAVFARADILQRKKGPFEKVLALYNKASQLEKELFEGAENTYTGNTPACLSYIYCGYKKYQLAASAMDEAIQIRKKVLKRHYHKLPSDLRILAGCELSAGNRDKALTLCSDVIRAAREVELPEVVEDFLDASVTKAKEDRSLDRDGKLALLDDAYEVVCSLKAQNPHFKVKSMLYDLAQPYFSLGAYKAAERVYREISSSGRELPAQFHCDFGRCLIRLKKWEEGRSHLRKAIDLSESSRRKPPPSWSADTYLMLARSTKNKVDKIAALENFHKYNDCEDAWFSEAYRINLLTQASVLLVKNDERTKGMEWFNEAVSRVRNLYPDGSDEQALLLYDVAFFFIKTTKAPCPLELTKEVYEAQKERDPVKAVSAVCFHVRNCLRHKKYELGFSYLTLAKDEAVKHYNRDIPRSLHIRLLELEGSLYQHQKEDKLASNCYERLADILFENPGLKTPSFLISVVKLAIDARSRLKEYKKAARLCSRLEAFLEGRSEGVSAQQLADVYMWHGNRLFNTRAYKHDALEPYRKGLKLLREQPDREAHRLRMINFLYAVGQVRHLYGFNRKAALEKYNEGLTLLTRIRD